jgi:uncharacterized protein (TIGR02145 family)
MPTVTDIDGNVYNTVRIGSQVWMKQNLKVTHFRNGVEIPIEENNNQWYQLTTAAYCNYMNNEDSAQIYGRLYNWYAVNNENNIAPEGWHVPTDEEWKQLEMYLGMYSEDADAIGWRGTDEGGKLKERCSSHKCHWTEPNEGACDRFGLCVLPNGFRYGFNFTTSGAFGGLHNVACLWTITENFITESGMYGAYYRKLGYYNAELFRDYADRTMLPWTNKEFGFAVRCVKDDQ